MCHLILMLPAIGLIAFWILPFSIAMPVYGLILIISGLLYYAMMKAMRQPVRTGSKGLKGETAEVIDMVNHEGHIKTHGEIWHAESRDDFHRGDKVRISEVIGLTAIIVKADSPKLKTNIVRQCAH